MIEWQKRGKDESTSMAKRMCWYTTCKQYKVEESKIIYGGPDGYPKTYRAMRLDGDRWVIISKHRTRKAATKAIEKHAKDNT
jgi:hypothetical protein